MRLASSLALILALCLPLWLGPGCGSGNKSLAGICQSGNQCPSSACYDSQCVTLCQQKKCDDQGLTCVLAGNLTLCVNPKLVSVGSEQPGDVLLPDQSETTEPDAQIADQPGSDTGTTDTGGQPSDAQRPMDLGPPMDFSAPDLAPVDASVPSDQSGDTASIDGGDGQQSDTPSGDLQGDSSSTADSTDTSNSDSSDALSGPVCPGYRGDLGVEHRLAPAVQVTLSGQTLYQIAIVDGGATLYVGDDSSTRRFSLPGLSETGSAATGFVTALLVSDDRVFVGRDSNNTTNFFALSRDLQTTHHSELLNDSPIFFLQHPQTATTIFIGGRGGTITQTTDNGASIDGTPLGMSGGAHISQLIAIANSTLVVATTGDEKQIMEYTLGDTSFTTFTYTPQTDPHISLKGWANWKTGQQAVVISGNGDMGNAVYSCDIPCRTPTLLGNSQLIGGAAVNSHTGGALGTYIRVGAGLIVTAVDTELWVSSDDGVTFRLIETLWNCQTPGAIYDLEIVDTTLYLATSGGLLLLDTATLK